MLLTLTHPDWNPPYRYVDATQAVTSRGNLYVPFPFNWQLPEQTDQGAQPGSLQVENISTEVEQLVMTTQGPPSATIELVQASAPDVVIYSDGPFEIGEATTSLEAIDIPLVYEDTTQEGIPQDSFTIGNFPALFRAA